VRNRRRVVYYAILLLLILGEILGEINYIIIIFPEYDRNSKRRLWQTGKDVEAENDLLNDLGFNLCVAPQSPVVRWMRILE